MEQAQTIVFIDTETTGLSPSTCKIIEIGVSIQQMDERGLLIGDVIEKQSLIDPSMPIPPAATNIHHITDAMVKNKPDFETIINAMMKVIPKGSVMVAHNAPFDMDFMLNEANMVSKRASDWMMSMKVIDTLPAYRQSFKGRANLAAMCKFFDVDFPEGDNHRAIVDVRMLRECYNKWTLGYSSLMMNPVLTPVPIKNIVSMQFTPEAMGVNTIKSSLLDRDVYTPVDEPMISWQ